MRLLTTLGVVALAGAASAQFDTIPVNTPVKNAGTFYAATGEFVRAGAVETTPSFSAAQIFDNSAFLGSFFQPGPGVKNVDWADLSATGQNEITEFVVGYATTQVTPVAINVEFRSGTSGFGVQGALEAAFSLTDLPASVSGGPEAFAITIDLTGFEFELPDGDFGYSFEALDLETGPLLVGPPNPAGVEDAWDRYDLLDTYINTQFFGGPPNPLASFYLQVTGQQPAQVPTAPARLLLSEFATTPTDGEFVEIFNPNSFPVDLTDVYLTDATFAGGGTFYYQIVEGGGGGGGFGDWFARFPAGAVIEAGEYQTVALNGSTAFNATYGVDPTYELAEDDVAPDAIPEMVEATPGSINGLQGGLTNFGEVVVLFSWDGQSDLVQDLDYVVYGDGVEGIDKTGVSIDGPDADADTSTYADDTPVASQEGNVAGATGTHPVGESWQRLHLSEGTETRTGGNGLTGNDEMSENVSFTWTEAAVTPNAATAGAVSLFITPGSVGPGTLELRGATNDQLVFVFASLGEDLTTLNRCPGEGLGLDLGAFLIAEFVTDASGNLDIPVPLPVAGVEVLIQCVDVVGCNWSNVSALDI